MLEEQIQLAAGPLKIVAWLQSGVEAAIHRTPCMFEDDKTDAVILVDVRNAFNSLNRQAGLHNIWVIALHMATIT